MKTEIEALVIIPQANKNCQPWQQPPKVCTEILTEIRILLKGFLEVLYLPRKMNRLLQKFNTMITQSHLILNLQDKKKLLKINYKAIARTKCQDNYSQKKAEFSKEEYLIPNQKY